MMSQRSMSAEPTPSPTPCVEDANFVNAKLIREGKTEVMLPPSVFYNPVQEFNRDLTIAVISQFSSEAREKFVNTGASKDSEAIRDVLNAAAKTDTAMCTSVVDSVEHDGDPDSTALSGDLDIATKSDGKHLSAKGSGQPLVATECLTELVEDRTLYDERPVTGEVRGAQGGLRILEALSASGLRSVRFALEIPGVREIVANDYDPVAVSYIRRNAEHNSVAHVVRPSCADAAALMHGSRRRKDRFDVVDLDPYGAPTTFLDAGVQCVAEGGLLCVTSTDMAVLCGNATETCHAKYGSTSIHAKFCHEMALRILLRCVDAHAARYGRYIMPLLSLSIDFYCRVFVRVFTGQAKVKDSAAKLAHVYRCSGCGAFELQPLVVRTPASKDKYNYSVATGPPVPPRCPHCNGRHSIAGPIWAAPLHDPPFVRRLLEGLTAPQRGHGGGRGKLGTEQRIVGMLSVVLEELEDVVLYHDMDDLCRIVHCTALGFLNIRSAVLNAGYRASLSHASKKSLKTDAPMHVIWDIIRCWVRTHPVRQERLKEGSTALYILSQPPSLEANFTLHPLANPPSRVKGLVRWQLNPESNWGPKARPSRKSGGVVPERGAGSEAGLEEGEGGEGRKSGKRKAERDQPRDMKRFACRRLQRGECDLGSDCRYSHDPSHLTQNASHASQNATQPSQNDTQNSQGAVCADTESEQSKTESVVDN